MEYKKVENLSIGKQDTVYRIARKTLDIQLNLN